MLRLITVVLCLALAAGELVAQEQYRYAGKIAALVEPYIRHRKANAISVGILAGNERWTGHYGTLDGDGTPAPDDRTIYEIGSISKVFTSVLLADAVESGRLKLNDPIGRILTELPTVNPKVANEITMLHLSHHMSGLPVTPGNVKPADPTNPFDGYDRSLLDEYLRTAKLSREPGTAYEYSNLGVGLLGDLLARQAGVSYEELLRKTVTIPLKMSNTGITLSAAQAARFAPPHNAALLPDNRWDFDALAGCGAIRSDIHDMLLFLQASLEPPGDSLGKALNLAWQKHKPRKGSDFAMGLGWMIAGDQSTRWHNGQTGGYQCMILANRSLKSAVVLLSNTAGSEVDRLAEQIFQAIVGIQVEPRSFEDAVQVAPETANRLAGQYQLAPGIIIEVKIRDGRMMAQITGQQFLAVIPKSDTEWKYQAVDATLKFELPKTGQSPKVTLLQSGRVLPAPRIASP